MNAAFGGARETDPNRKVEHVATACPSRVSDRGLSHAEGGDSQAVWQLGCCPLRRSSAAKPACHEDFFLQDG